MRPRADEIMASILASFEEYIVPEVEEPFAQSVTLTLSNLMRLVKLRIEQEGPMLHADNVDIRDTLATVRAYLAEHPSGVEAIVREIDEALAAPALPTDDYPTLAWMSAQSTRLRWALQHALEALEGSAGDRRGEERYDAVRTSIRHYLRRSVEREGAVIIPAFTGERR